MSLQGNACSVIGKLYLSSRIEKIKIRVCTDRGGGLLSKKLTGMDKDLGLILDEKLTFCSHIKELLGKANEGIGMIKLLSRYLPRPSLDQIYKLHVRSHFDYCDIIYHVPPVDNPCSQEYTQNLLMNRLESMQYNAALAITGAWRGTSREKIYKELGWESLSDRRWYRRLVLFFKIVNGLVPDYLFSLLPEIREQRYDLRNTYSYEVPKRRTDAFKNSFFHTASTSGKN